LAAEYRAFACQRYSPVNGQFQPKVPALDDIARFNDAIDQALAESVGIL
jgi:hypothetical protein